MGQTAPVSSADGVGQILEENAPAGARTSPAGRLEQFRARYHDSSIGKWDIFHYIYAVLHHPEYRERYAANLRRELPRIPFVSAILSNNCHSEPASAGEESDPSADKKQIPRFARNDKGG
jgi:predicted helicase